MAKNWLAHLRIISKMKFSSTFFQKFTYSPIYYTSYATYDSNRVKLRRNEIKYDRPKNVPVTIGIGQDVILVDPSSDCSILIMSRPAKEKSFVHSIQMVNAEWAGQQSKPTRITKLF